MTGPQILAAKRSRPVPYDTFRQRVRRHRRTDVLVAVAALNTRLQRVEFGQEPPLGLPNGVAPFSLAGVARTALVAGNDHRSSAVTVDDLVEMCSYYANIAEPAFGRDPGAVRLRSVMNHMAYEQFGHQQSPMENVGRSLALLADHASAAPDAPDAEAWAAALGVHLELFLRLGFAMHVAAVSNGGSIDRRVLLMDHVAPIFTPLNPDEALQVIDHWFAATPAQLRQAGIAQEAPGYEKWALSPLVAKPIVALADGRYLIPWPRLLLDRISATGLYFIGIDQFGPSFPDNLGAMFQAYVGSHLSLLRHAEIQSEITYGRHGERTVDFFIITPEVVVLLEVKAARPILATRLGEAAGDDDTAKKVGYAFTQIDRTARLIDQAHPAVAHIPSDRPLRGLVVTLEPFYLVNTPFYDDIFSRPSISTTVASAHELEGAIALLRDTPDLGRRLHAALTPDAGKVTSLASAADGLTNAANPLLDGAWERFSYAWSPSA